MAIQTFRLVMRKGPTPGQIFELSKSEIYLGRDISNDIVINDAEVSRKHIRLTLDVGRYKIEDLGSTNGTFINGQRLMGPHILALNEMIMLGETVGLIFEGTQPDAGATVVGSHEASRMGQPAAPVYPAQQQPAYIPPPQPAYAPPAELSYAPQQPSYAAPQPPPPPQIYSGQVPPGPLEAVSPAPAAPSKKPINQWLLAGCGCLLIVLCLVVASAIAFDALELYCKPPFDSIFITLGYGCP